MEREIQTAAAEQFIEKTGPSTSVAKACTEERSFVAALKRWATKINVFQQTVKPQCISLTMTRLKSCPDTSRSTATARRERFAETAAGHYP